MTADELACSSEACTADAHKIFDFGSGYVSLDMLKEAMIRSGIDGRIVDHTLLHGLCELPGCDGKFHCHCSDRMGLLCRSKTALMFKAVVGEINRGRDNFLGGAAITYYGYDYCRCYTIGNALWVKCEGRDAMKILGFMGAIAVFGAQFRTKDGKSLLELRLKGFSGANEVLKCLKEYTEYENMGEGGELDVLGMKMKYGTSITVFPRFCKNANKKSAHYRVSCAVFHKRSEVGAIRHGLDDPESCPLDAGIVRFSEVSLERLLLVPDEVRRAALSLLQTPEPAVHEQGDLRTEHAQALQDHGYGQRQAEGQVHRRPRVRGREAGVRSRYRAAPLSDGLRSYSLPAVGEGSVVREGPSSC